MFGDITFDELNQMVENPRALPYEEYFGEMELTETEKKKRISLAEKLEENFLPILIWLFTMQQFGGISNWEAVRLRFETEYQKSINGVVDLDNYTKKRIKTFSYDVTESTQNHVEDFWYYSKDRVQFMSENESNISWEYQTYTDAIKKGKTRKQWVSMRDKRVRHTHRQVDGKIIGIRDVFLVGDSLMLHSGDSSLGAEAKELIACRCTTKYF